MPENLKTSSLSRQLIITIILFSSVITLILTAIQLFLEYQRDTGEIDARLQQVKSSYQRSIENAIWDLDKKQMQIQIDGIHQLPDIEYAEIISEGGLFLSSGAKTQSKRIKTRQYDLSHAQEGKNYPLGKLTVVANLEAAYDRLLNRLGTVLLSNALKTFLVALFITFLLKRKVIRHLENVSAFLSQLGANKLDQQFKLERKKLRKGQQDELSILENSVNHLRSNLSHSLTEIQVAGKRYRWLVQNSNEFIYRVGFKKPVPVNHPIDEQVRLIFEHGYAAEWNDALSKKFGYTDKQLANMSLHELHPLFDKDNLQSIEEFIRSGYRINEAEVHVPDVNGKIFTVLMSLSGVIENDHLVYIWGQDTDITERIKAQQKLQDNEARLIAAQRIAQIGYWDHDIANDKTIWSDESYRIYGYEPQSFIPDTKFFQSILHPDDHDRVMTAFNLAFKEPASMEFRIIRPDGTHRFISGTAQVSETDQGKPVQLFGVIQDITDRKQLEESNRRQELQLIQADKMSSLGLLVSGVAHEINNPNNLIQINASMLEEMWRDTRPVLDKYLAENSSFLIGGLPYEDAIESMPDMISGLTDASRRIERIIDDLKNFARRGDNQNIVEISVNEAIESAVRLLQPLIKSNTNYLQLELADDLPSIKGNLQHVEQIVINLLSNALDALPDKNHKVWISSLFDYKTNQILIQIKDNGMGISEADQKNIFDPFFTTKNHSGGTGLGLAIAFNLAKEYEGHLSCSSVSNEGTIFTVSFPRL